MTPVACPQCYAEFSIDLATIPPGKLAYVACPSCAKRSDHRAAVDALERKLAEIEQARCQEERQAKLAAEHAEKMRRWEADAWIEHQRREKADRDRRRQAAGRKKPDPPADSTSAPVPPPPVYCVHCEHQCSAAASACPQCGHPLSEPVTPIVTIRGRPKVAIACLVVSTLIGGSIWVNRNARGRPAPPVQSTVSTQPLASPQLSPDRLLGQSAAAVRARMLTPDGNWEHDVSVCLRKNDQLCIRDRQSAVVFTFNGSVAAVTSAQVLWPTPVYLEESEQTKRDRMLTVLAIVMFVANAYEIPIAEWWDESDAAYLAQYKINPDAPFVSVRYTDDLIFEFSYTVRNGTIFRYITVNLR